MKSLLSLLAATAALCFGGAALGLTQPDGAVVPAGSCLQSLFDARGEQIDALADAAILPQTFVPGCDLVFEVIARNAGYMNSFGWYNATGQQPEDSQLNEFLSCTDVVGTTKTLSIRSDPRYAGGEVGFYQAVGSCGTTSDHLYVFYSEPQYNPDASVENPFVHLLIYNSTAVPRAFYFGWEDLISGGDNDFDDLTTFVTGITCSGGGGSCQTALPGICAAGSVQCQSGELVCVGHLQPAAEESCNGLDDDCDGQVDDGASCPQGELCDLGRCVRRCAGELGCRQGLVCGIHDVCVEPACVEIECPSGTRCFGGDCKAPCDNVACPHGQVCRAGVCVDPCDSVSCDQADVCVAGICAARCQCSGCPEGESCQEDGRCLAEACVGRSCAPGEWCDASGECRDRCESAICPAGERCVEGACELAPPDAGVDAGTHAGPDGGADAGGLDYEEDGGLDAGSVSPSDGGASATAIESSCGCPAAGGGAPSAFALLSAAFAALGLLRRR